jgi:hypothetical protein
MLANDSRKKPKHIAQIQERKEVPERAKNRLKKDIIDIQEKAIYESHENKLCIHLRS